MYKKEFDEIDNCWNVYRETYNNSYEYLYSFYTEDLADLMIFCLERTIQ